MMETTGLPSGHILPFTGRGVPHRHHRQSPGQAQNLRSGCGPLLGFRHPAGSCSAIVVCSLQTPLWAWLWPSPGGCLYPEAGVMKVKLKDCPVNRPGFTRVTAALSLKTQELSQHRLWPISPCRPPPYTSLSVPRPGGS